MKAELGQIASWLHPALFLLDVEARDSKQALEAAACAIARHHALREASVFNALWRREQSASTALGNGFAIPHARVAGLVAPVVAFVRCAQAVPFGAADGVPVSDLLVITAPLAGDKEDHLRLLAMVVSLFSDPAFRDEIHGAETETVAAQAFRSGVSRALTNHESH